MNKQIFADLSIFLGNFFNSAHPQTFPEVPQKIWTGFVQPFWHLLDTNIQTNKPTDK